MSKELHFDQNDVEAAMTYLRLNAQETSQLFPRPQKQRVQKEKITSAELEKKLEYLRKVRKMCRG